MAYILIVEDKIFLSNIMRVRLEDEGYRVKLASDGKEALKLLEEGIPDVVLLDLIMPNMNGFDFLAQMKENVLYKDIPVIVTTNLNQNEDMIRVKAMGVTEYIVKSDITMDELEDKVTKIVKKNTNSHN